jgi:hypothetical protein
VNTCLLCPSPAVADGLCADDGARLWAAQLWAKRPEYARPYAGASQVAVKAGSTDPHDIALDSVSTPDAARAFLDRLEAAKAARAEAPVCKRGCKSHDGEEGR